MTGDVEILKPKGISLDRLQTLGRFTKDVVEGFFFGRETKCLVVRTTLIFATTFSAATSATHFIETAGKGADGDEKQSVSPAEVSRANLRSFLMSEIFTRTGGVLDTSWDVIPRDPVKIWVADEAGINLRDFPDKRIGNIVGALQYNPDPEKFVEGEFRDFVVYKGRDGVVTSIWAAKDSERGREFFSINDEQQSLANLIAIRQ